jgi:hypothetical protein
VLSGDGFAGERIVDISWTGSGPPRLLPDAIEFSLRPGERATREVEVINLDKGAGIELVGLDGLPSWLSADFLTINDPGRAGPSRMVLRLHAVGPQSANGVDSGAVRLRQSGRDFSLPLQVALDLNDGIRARPKQLLVAVGNEGKASIKDYFVMIETLSGAPPKVVAAPPSSEIDFKSLPGGGGKYLMRVAFKGPPQVRVDEGVELADGDKRLKIPVRFLK